MVSFGRLFIFIWVARYKSVLAFLQKQGICYLATCVFLGQNLIRCFQHYFMGQVGFTLFCARFHVLTAEHYLILHFITTDQWKLENFPNSEIAYVIADQFSAGTESFNRISQKLMCDQNWNFLMIQSRDLTTRHSPVTGLWWLCKLKPSEKCVTEIQEPDNESAAGHLN